MTGKQIIGWQYKVTIGDKDIVETMHEELSDEAIDYISRIEEAGNDLMDMLYNEDEVHEESIKYAQDVLTDLYNGIKDKKKSLSIGDVLCAIEGMYNKLEKELNDGKKTDN